MPVKVKQQKHTHTLLKPIHVHHKPRVIKEEKVVEKEIHKPIHITKHHEPIEIHKPFEFHEEVHHKPFEVKKHPIYKEEVSHEHLHHHYKVCLANL